MTYEADFVAWTERQAALLKAMDPVPADLDVDNLADELIGLGLSEVAVAEGLIQRLLVTLIKLAESSDSSDAPAWIEEALLIQGDTAIFCTAGIGQHVHLPEIWARAKVTSRSLRFETVARSARSASKTCSTSISIRSTLRRR